MEIVKVSSLVFVNCFLLSLLTIWFCGESITSRFSVLITSE